MPLSADLVARLARDHDLGVVTGVVPLGGSQNAVVLVRTDRGEHVVRVGAVHDLRRERYFARVVHERARTLASPWPFVVDETLGAAVMPRLPGAALRPGRAGRGDRVGAAFGRAVAELHDIRFSAAGEWDAAVDDLRPDDRTAAEAFLARVRQHALAASLAPDDRAFVDAAVEPAAAAIGDIVPTYVHGDLGLGNLLADRAPDGLRFTGVLDLGGGRAGDPDEDIAVAIWWPLYANDDALATSFLRAYRSRQAARAHEALRMRGYLALSLLRTWETGRRDGRDWFGGATLFETWASPLLERGARVVDEVARG
ncbi:MAG: aminoglycoside phosphotransferase family protein [Microbacterium ginsengisoli]|uniref:phosphotransferase family protein n=1 Tax=Microbacterium TaxID=33882 RepID=UPI0012E3C142|nr:MULTISPECIES: aminoglycoside phosphotransferase family protein [unclassified Microbacterium]MBN9198421.1 aminoglycoside phosphotransferase family protein [Microbacterium ginsengisoli]